MENQEKNSQMIVDDVIGQIGSGRLKISEALPSEREMTQLYHVSRSCVREAMQVLALLGIVRIRPKEKTRVQAFQIEPFIQRISPLLFAQMGCEQDIAQFRLAVEIKAAQLDEGLMELVAAMRRCEDEAQAAQLDLQFHKALVHNSGNSLLKIALDSVGSLMEYSVAHNRRQISTHSSLAILIDQHEQLTRTIAARQTEKAAELMKRHLRLEENREEIEK